MTAKVVGSIDGQDGIRYVRRPNGTLAIIVSGDDLARALGATFATFAADHETSSPPEGAADDDHIPGPDVHGPE